MNHEEKNLLTRVMDSAKAWQPQTSNSSFTTELLPPHASNRRYARVKWQGGRSTHVVMLMPVDVAPPDEGGQSASPLALAEDPFVQTSAWLAELGVRVPAVHFIHEPTLTIWLEDAGHHDFDGWIASGAESMADAYARALTLLTEFQRRTQSQPVPDLVSRRRFDAALLKWELDHYVEWRLQEQLGVQPTAAQQSALQNAFERLVADVAAIPLAPIHRDFQSHNVMVLPNRELVLLDHQDAMMGSVVYDAVALLRDSYIEIPHSLLGELVARVSTSIAATSAARGASPETVQRWFWLQTLQRKLKDAGRFVYIDRVKGNPGFLRFIDSSLRYVADAASRLPEYGDLFDVLVEIDSGIASSVRSHDRT